MKIDASNIQQVTREVFSLDGYFNLDKSDFDRFFPKMDEVEGFRVEGDTVADVVEKIKEEVKGDIISPRYLVYYVGRNLEILDIRLLDRAFGFRGRWKRGAILSELPYGVITVFVFYQANYSASTIGKGELNEIVESIRQKLGVKQNADNLVKLYRADRCDNDLADPFPLPESARKRFFPWLDIVGCMQDNPKAVFITNKKCPVCGHNLLRINFSSPNWTWRELCGRSGALTICPQCPKQIDFSLEEMS